MGRGRAGNAVCPSTLRWSARAINARGFTSSTCTSLQQRERHRLQHHSSGACDRLLGQVLPGRSAPVGLGKLHKQVSPTPLPVCSKHAKDRLCLSVGGHTERFKRGTNSVTLLMPSPPLTLPLISHKNMELEMSEKEAGQRGEGCSCLAEGSG